MELGESLRLAADELRKLKMSCPTSSADVATWSRRASETIVRLENAHSRIKMPEQVWHYVHDADLRIKDSEYRKTQDEVLEGIIASFERGIVPESTGVTYRVRLRSIAVVALTVTAICIWFLLR